MSNLNIIQTKRHKTVPATNKSFAENYFILCCKERKIYTDEEVALLPSIGKAHPHHNEWMLKKNFLKKFIAYINQNGNSLNILEVGCGNGWLAAQLAAITTGEVTGIDINVNELAQSQRVFGKITNLNFLTGEFRNGILEENKFDLIIFSSSIQYFPSLKEIIAVAMDHLTLFGQIHIMDTPIYQQKDIATVKQNAKEYYFKIGIPSMARFHFYHTIDELDDFQYKFLYQPGTWLHKFSFRVNPCPWILIKNRYQ